MSLEETESNLNGSLNQIKNICPQVTNAFIFRENQILAKDKTTTEETINSTREAFISVAEKAAPINGIEAITFQGTKGSAKIFCAKNTCLTTVSTSEVDEEALDTATSALVIDMLKLANTLPEPQQENPLSEQKYATNVEEANKNQIESADESEDSFSIKEIESNELNGVEEANPSTSLFTDAPVSQFVVENSRGLGGFLANADVLRLDAALIGQWGEFFGEGKITEAIVENRENGKRLRCKFEPIKESKYEGIGVVLVSEKMQNLLGTRKGKTVLIKPATEPEKDPAETSKNSEQDYSPNNSSYFMEPTASQFMVANIAGYVFLGSPDVAQVDGALIAQWAELFGDKPIKEITVENTVTGKRMRCKFKPIKEQKYEGKGIVMISQKIQQTLQTQKGALVTIRPIIE